MRGKGSQRAAPLARERDYADGVAGVLPAAAQGRVTLLIKLRPSTREAVMTPPKSAPVTPAVPASWPVK